MTGSEILLFIWSLTFDVAISSIPNKFLLPITEPETTELGFEAEVREKPLSISEEPSEKLSSEQEESKND